MLYKVALMIPKKVIFLNSADLELFANNKLVNVNKAEILKGIGVDLNFWTPARRKKITLCLYLYQDFFTIKV